tara:strand:+ start:1538 stop:1936 length:399 start_codon:yes stop_codon:yes gene_type:complete
MPTSEESRSKGLGAAARVTALASSIMDLHVRIALQEMDREKRRLISGGIFLAMGGVLMLFTLLALEIILILFMQNKMNWNLDLSLVVIVLINLIFAGLSLRVGGQLTKGPYLPETLEGISRTTKAMFGKYSN